MHRAYVLILVQYNITNLNKLAQGTKYHQPFFFFFYFEYKPDCREALLMKTATIYLNIFYLTLIKNTVYLFFNLDFHTAKQN